MATVARAIRARPRAPMFSGRLVITAPFRSQPRAGCAGGMAKLRYNGTSKQVERGNDAGDEYDRSHAGPEAQPLFDDCARLLAVAVEQERLGVKAHSTG